MQGLSGGREIRLRRMIDRARAKPVTVAKHALLALCDRLEVALAEADTTPRSPPRYQRHRAA